jgi:hypothetical protein
MLQFKPSMFNRIVQGGVGVVLYNSATGINGIRKIREASTLTQLNFNDKINPNVHTGGLIDEDIVSHHAKRFGA